MDISPFSIAGGFVLGLASSLHCAAMCGGICSGFLMMFDTRTPAARARVVTLLNLGRLTSYALGGAAIGAAGAGLVGQLPSTLAYRVLQWAGAVTLMWIGLSTAGLLPATAVVDRVLAPVTGAIARTAPRLGASPAAPYLTGMAWGAMPCAMVYAALMTAMLTGTALGGASVMIGFALGTIPAVAAASFGIGSLARLSTTGATRMAVGLAIAAFGFATVYVPHTFIEWLCR